MATHSIIAQLPVELLSRPVPVAGGGGGQCIVDLAAAVRMLGSFCGGGLELQFDGRVQAVDVHREENTICVTPTPTVPEDNSGGDGSQPPQHQQSRPPFVKAPMQPAEPPTTSTSSNSVVSAVITSASPAETCDDDTASTTAPVTQEYKHVPAAPVPGAGDGGFVTLVRPPSASSSSSPAVPGTTTRTLTSVTGYPVSPAPEAPVPVPQSQAPPAVQTVPVYAVSLPAPAPAAPPSSCTSEYETIDVTKVEGIDHKTLGVYLGVLDLDLSDILGRHGGLLGLGDLLSGGGGSKSSSSSEAVTRATKKTYRMSCGVWLPTYAAGEEEAARPPTTAPSHQKCLEACVRCAVDDAARSGAPADCVAAAHNPGLAEGNCHFWIGLRSQRQEHEHEYEQTPPNTGDDGGAARGSGHGTWNVANLGGEQFVN